MVSDYWLTPVESHDGLLVKRDDLYAPYGLGDVNGGKLRQCHALLQSEAGLNGVVTACSIHSPQAPICAAVAEEMGVECHVLYGGTTPQRLMDMPMPRLAVAHGAKIHIAAKTGRHNVLYKAAQQLAKEKDYFVVEYGFNLTQNEQAMIGAVSDQCKNLPEIERVALVCGSGITACGVMKGLIITGNPVKEIHLYATAPSRKDLITNTLGVVPFKLVFHDLFHEPGFLYEHQEPFTYDGIRLHPNYEAKGLKRFIQEGMPKDGTLFWIVGAYPYRADRIHLV